MIPIRWIGDRNEVIDQIEFKVVSILPNWEQKINF